MTPRVYLAGPMTGHPFWNFPAFYSAEETLRAAGAEVINPARHDEENGFDPTAPVGEYTPADLHAAMLWDLQQVLDPATAGVVFLPGSTNSTGASLEMRVARAVGKPVVPLYIALVQLKASGNIHV